MKLFYREVGEGQPIIILHGVFGSSDNWLTPAKALSAKFKIYLVDQRNHGHSPNTDEFDNNLLANDLAEFIEEHSIVNPIIIGHSMGGKVAINYVAKHPSEVKQLVVVDIAPRYYPPHHQSILAGLNSLNFKTLQSRQEADQELTKYIPELGIRQFLLKNLYRDDEGFKWRINLPVITEKIENVAEKVNAEIINVPTLFIRGSESHYISSKDEETIKSMFTNVKIETIAGAGHWVQAEKPVEFLECLYRFIK